MLTRCWREVDSNHRSRRRGTAVPTPTSVSRLGDNAREGPNPLPSSGESTPSGISPCHGEKEHDQAEGRSSMVAGFGAVTLVAAEPGEAGERASDARSIRDRCRFLPPSCQPWLRPLDRGLTSLVARAPAEGGGENEFEVRLTRRWRRRVTQRARSPRFV